MSSNITIKEPQAGQRLDIFCANQFPDYSRSALQKAIKAGQITVNNDTVKPKYPLRAGDTLSINLQSPTTTPPVEISPPDIHIIHEDKDLVVIDKPAGVLAHTAVNANAPTVTSWYTQRYPTAASVGEDPSRPGLVHRLDRDTSGVMVLAKTQVAYRHLKKQFKKHYAKKEYLALVFGVPNAKDGRINQAITRSRQNPSRRTILAKRGLPSEALAKEGKPAITEWQLEKPIGHRHALIRAFPLTGRTHQIRVHLHFIGHPIVGDPLYTFKRQKSPSGVSRQLLHAEKLTIQLPTSKKKTFTAPLPEDFQAVLDQLSSGLSSSNQDSKPLGFRTPSSFKAKM